MIQDVKQMIQTINKIHSDFSTDYFESGKIEKINLSQTIRKVSREHIAFYRLNLHESINDYLIRNQRGLPLRYYYRVKTLESIDNKIERYAENTNQYPVNNWMNDIFGARIILTSEEIGEVLPLLNDWREEFGLKNWYLREKDGYRGLHIYFKNRSNFYFPWELQIWDEADIQTNIENHEKYKRLFV